MANRNDYELAGVRVLEKVLKHKFSGKKAGTKYYRLNITAESKPELKYIDAYQDKLGLVGKVSQEQMWTDILDSNYIDKRYLFYYRYGAYSSMELVGWREL